ncbi:MAG TPA: hypothetical protein PLB97_00965, partial [Accumulibacter sp.]|nr:hypothetical protein [Accumulibacter sp.]
LKKIGSLQRNPEVVYKDMSQAPTQTMQKWFISNPEIFHRKPDDRTGCDIGNVSLSGNECQ